MDVSPDFPAVLLGQEAVKKLITRETLDQVSALNLAITKDVLLSPANALQQDVRSLSGCLGFASDEILYIFHKQYPFVYMLDQWLKRESEESASLKMMHKALIDIRRPDAAEIIENVILELYDRDPKEIKQSLEQHKRQLRRCSSTTTLCTPYEENATQAPVYDHHQKDSDKFNVPGKIVDIKSSSQLQKRAVASDAPDVFTVYFRDNEQHLKNVRRFIKHLRKHGIDATADMFESTESASDRGFYIYNRLIKAEYVFVVCSPLFFASYEHERNHPGEPTSGLKLAKKLGGGVIFEQPESMLKYLSSTFESVREVSFIMKLILDDIFIKAGVNSKYIPVLLPNSSEQHVPFILQGATKYKMPGEFEDLKRRVFKIEKYKLKPMPQHRPVLKPKQIGGLDLLKISKWK